ncbi:extracellular solute-binding protein [Paenibacillus alginolyticus]|uniref:Extracellular solute-binding protein n=1 Tax=Paenibacillus alginolyticus TaxID=59839 RepID=A0ABT4GI55_9BACL|nr:extracellular solute-binding protein [Paenibacillus alginolyticus]MCY9667181.1 extracellular solute-binding protein [Paenibacillus alginolyticus]MCY9695884.1 extracellular solute-binding protein [Paenibacillus alginolyticus]MEC0141759.1 extracellular solute-binding protein [Paenibacillus alginolyticus]
MFTTKKTFKVLLSTVLMGSVIAGCSTKENTASPSDKPAATTDSKANDMTPIKMTFFDKNTGDAFTNEVAKEITKRTGVTIEIQQPTGNPSEKLNLMLASSDLPDIVLMDRGGDIVNKYIAAGAIIPLDDLIAKYGPNVKKMYGDTLKKTRYTDGKNYYLSNWYGPGNEPVFGMNMRMDWLKQLAPDKVEGGKPFSADEFEALLKDFKAKFGKADGKDVFPMTFNGENIGAVLGTFKGMWGMKSFFEDNGTLKYDVKDPKYKDMLLYLNKLYREGLIDPEWPVNKKQTWEQKISNGLVFATPGAYWDLGTSNGVLKKAGGPEKQLYSYKLVGPGVDPAKTTLGPSSTLGWDAIAITKTNKNPERTMKLIDFLASEEGQYLLMWGIEGVHWDMKDGKHVPRPEVLQGFKDDWDNYVKKTGIRKWTWFIKSGKGSDGTVYDMPVRYQRGEIDQMALKNLSDSTWDTTVYDNLGPAGGTPDALVSQKVSDIMSQTITKVIISKTDTDASALFDKMLADMKAAGDEKVEKIINDNYKKRLDLWK